MNQNVVEGRGVQNASSRRRGGSPKLARMRMGGARGGFVRAEKGGRELKGKRKEPY